MQINADYVWIVPIVMSFVSGIVIWKSSQSQRISNPNMTNDYNKILKWVMGYCNLPWIFMGIGNVFQISTAEDYKQFKISNPAVLIFYLSILILLGLMTRWLYFKNGAEFIRKHPIRWGIFDSGDASELSKSQLEVGFAFILVAALSSIAFLWIRSMK